MKRLLLISIIVVTAFNQCGGVQSSTMSEAEVHPASPGIVYSNPRVYNVDYIFEMFPDPNKIDRAKDLKVWLPIPREWDSQKAVQIISVQPEAHGQYVDPEYGNPMLFWDFGKEPEQPSYKVDIKFRLEAYKVDVEIDPSQVGSYDKTSKEYALYTRSTHTIHITPKIKEMARKAVGDETNPYLQAKRIRDFVRRKVHYKILDYERGRGIDCLLAYPATDERVGEEFYEGCCNQIAALTVALCRSVGIPARCVHGQLGWAPWIEKDDAKSAYLFETKLSPEGLAATQIYGEFVGHVWPEIFIPNYGWIPADYPIGHWPNTLWISDKGRDVLLGPSVVPKNGEGYGSQWVPVHDGRADLLFRAVFNIAKIHTSKVMILHDSDPFPADGLAAYPTNPFPSDETERNLRRWRQGALSTPSYLARSPVSNALNAEQFYKDCPQAREDREAFVCHMLRRQLGDQAFFKLVKEYVDQRQKSSQAVPIIRFQKLAENISGQSLDWFFKEWVNRMDAPRLKLEQINVRRDQEGWQLQGRLLQLGETTFQLPIELALDTDNGREVRKLWMDSKAVDFSFQTPSEPRKLIVDPNDEILKVKIAPHLRWFRDMYPKIIVVYGTLGEAEANKTAAERFHGLYLGSWGQDIINVKADTDVNDADLKAKCIILIGRPETNKITHKFKDIFPIRFDKNTFTWQGTTFAQAIQGVTQVVDNPKDAEGRIILHAGLSAEATQKFISWHVYPWDSSYIIFDGDKLPFAGDWALEEHASGSLEWSRNVSTGGNLHFAAWSGDLTTVERLTQQGSDVDIKDEFGCTPLHCALRRKQTNVAEFLVAAGANVNEKDQKGRPPLHLAARENQKELVEMLISKGANVNAKDPGRETALHIAASEGHKEVVELLLAHGADVNAGGYYNFTAAESAMNRGHTEIVELLISKGADISPLHLAIYLKGETKAKRLIEAGADVNKRTPYGTTPLDRAVNAGFRDIVRLLLDRGADVNVKDNWNWTALHSAIYSSKDTAEIKAMVELLIARGANVNARDGDYLTPLWYARKEGYSEIVELLKKHGAKE